MDPPGSLQQVHYDEEDCLGLELFVAELELLLGRKDQRPDQTQLLELLPKLHISIGGADAAAVKRNQRRCEAALADLLRRGPCPVVSVAPGNRLMQQRMLLPCAPACVCSEQQPWC